MNFMDLFVPITAAFITASVIMEFLHFLLGLCLAKRQRARQEAYYSQMAEKLGVSTEDFMATLEQSMGGGMGGGMPMMFDLPAGSELTASGTAQREEHGQYL